MAINPVTIKSDFSSAMVRFIMLGGFDDRRGKNKKVWLLKVHIQIRGDFFISIQNKGF